MYKHNWCKVQDWLMPTSVMIHEETKCIKCNMKKQVEIDGVRDSISFYAITCSISNAEFNLKELLK